MNERPARRLSKEHGVDVEQSLYSMTGSWYAHPKKFPAALWDAHGYIVFRTQEDYWASAYLSRGKQLGVPNGGISCIPGYKRVK